MADFEVVVRGLADRIKLFLKYFDWIINHSHLDEVTKIGMSEWDLWRNWGSASGRVSITPIGNNIICRATIRENYAFPLLEEVVRNVIEDAKRIIIAETPEPIPPGSGKTKLRDCPVCGRALYSEVVSCPFCGSKLEKCIVCKLVIEKEQEIVICPYCAGRAHRDHILEYVKIKGRCPSCRNALRKESLLFG
jgi:hypothetical protein